MYTFTDNQYNYLAASYGSGAAYGTSTYDNNVYGYTTTSTTSSSSGGSLVNTGFIVLSVVTVAVVIIFIALLVRFFHKPKKTITDPAKPGSSPPASRF